MLDPTVSMNKKTTFEHAEKNEKKETKKTDKKLEQIFDQYLHEKISREKKSERKSYAFSQISLQSKFDSEAEDLAAKVGGLIRDDSKQAKNRTDISTDSDIVVASQSNPLVPDTDTQNSDQQDADKVVAKLQKIIEDMSARSISTSDLLISIEGQSGITLNVAFVKEKNQTDIFISSRSEKALNLVSNQAGRIEKALSLNSDLQVSLSVVS